MPQSTLSFADRARGVDLVTTAEAERLGTSDSEQLDYAIDHGRAIYTFNAGDFARLHREYLEQRRLLSVSSRRQ